MAEIREIIASAEPVCAALDAVYEDLRSARAQQAEAMLALAQALEEKQVAARETSHRRDQLLREMATLEEARRLEEAERETERDWTSDAHYDPRYDEREIAIRRARPWV